MRARIRSSELRSMTVEDRVSKLAHEMGAAARAKPNGEVRELAEQIGAFEARFGIDSATLRREVESGVRPETWEVCQWLMLLHRRDRLVARTG